MKPGVIERAYELARSSECRALSDVKTRLKSEGYIGVDHHLEGHAIRRSLRAQFHASSPERPAPVARATDDF